MQLKVEASCWLLRLPHGEYRCASRAKEAQVRLVELLSLPTKNAIAILDGSRKDTNAILHMTC